MEDDWDLYAVVRSCCRSSNSTTTTSISSTTTTTTNTTPPPLPLPLPLPLPTTTTTSITPILDSSFSLYEKDNSFFASSDLFQPQSPLNELEQLYKPFVPNYQQQLQLQQQPISPFIPNPNPNPNLNLNFNPNPISPLSNLSSPSILPPRLKTEIQLPRRSISTSTITPRPKRRKNQQKKVVCQVPAEGLSSDMWAWRKYGQKPIKGSPYPRGYYRCSSSKGCLARKQVERSRTDPGMFIVTYTAEHNHPVPTHRNSLAGSTRHKLSTPSAITTNISKPSTSTSPLGLSPTTPLTSSMEEDEEEQSKDGEDDNTNSNNNNHNNGFSKLEEGLMSDDLFMELERQGEGEGEGEATSSGFFDDCFTPSPLWFNTTSATAAGSV